MSTLPEDPEGGGHALRGNIRRLKSGHQAGGNAFPSEQALGEGVEIGGGGLRLMDGEKKRTARGKQGQTGEQKGFEFALDAEGSPATAVGKRGWIENDRIKGFTPASQAGQDATDILRPEAVGGSAQLVQLVIFFSAGEGPGRGVDIQGLGPERAGANPEGTRVCEKVEEAVGADRFQVKTVFALIGKKSGGDSGGEVDFVAQSKLRHLSLETVPVEKGCGGLRLLLDQDPFRPPG